MTAPSDDKPPILATDRRSIVIGRLTDDERRRLAEARMDPRHVQLNALING
jgi:hypothetical protein